MPFDKTQPTNTTKIRNLGTVIRPNWDAIELGDASFKPQAINLANRTPAVVPIDPVAIANVYQLYCKEDVHAKTQIYAIDPSSKISQITSSAVPVNQANKGYSWLPGGFLIQWGYENAPAGESAKITFGFPFDVAPYSIQLTPVRSVTNTANCMYVSNAHAPDTTGFRIVNTSSGAHEVYWLAIGKLV